MLDIDDSFFPQWVCNKGSGEFRISGGITKREYFAGCALQGILANIPFGDLTKSKLHSIVVYADDASHKMMENAVDGC